MTFYKSARDFIDKYYVHNRHVFRKPSCVFKYEEGEGEEERRLYISFDCGKERQPCEQWRRASHEGQKDLSLMRDTRLLFILFA
uniref:NTF2 domain-containing protein n=1 Tax=Steinernema glaseri TaxID=37863 RepID=A0A1I8AQQ6_9BILA